MHISNFSCKTPQCPPDRCNNSIKSNINRVSLAFHPSTPKIQHLWLLATPKGHFNRQIQRRTLGQFANHPAPKHFFHAQQITPLHPRIHIFPERKQHAEVFPVPGKAHFISPDWLLVQSIKFSILIKCRHFTPVRFYPKSINHIRGHCLAQHIFHINPSQQAQTEFRKNNRPHRYDQIIMQSGTVNQHTPAFIKILVIQAPLRPYPFIGHIAVICPGIPTALHRCVVKLSLCISHHAASGSPYLVFLPQTGQCHQKQ